MKIARFFSALVAVFALLISTPGVLAAPTGMLAYTVNSDSNLHVRNADGTADKVLWTAPSGSSLGHVGLLSDGSKVAVEVTDGASTVREVKVISTSDGQVTQTVSLNVNTQLLLATSWDLTQLLISEGSNYKLKDVATGTETALVGLGGTVGVTDVLTPVGFTTDDLSLVVNRQNVATTTTDMVKYLLVDGTLTTLKAGVAASPAAQLRAYNVSPDGTVSYFASLDTSCNTAYTENMIQEDGTGDAGFAVATGSTTMFSPDGSLVLYIDAGVPPTIKCMGTMDPTFKIANRDGSNASTAFAGSLVAWSNGVVLGVSTTNSSPVPTTTPAATAQTLANTGTFISVFAVLASLVLICTILVASKRRVYVALHK